MRRECIPEAIDRRPQPLADVISQVFDQPNTEEAS